MTHKTQLTNDVSTFLNTDENAEMVNYMPVGSDIANEISAIVNRNAPFQEPYVRGEKTALGDIWVDRSDVTDPQQGDTFEITLETWEHDSSIKIETEIWEFDPEQGVIEYTEDMLNIGIKRRD